MLLATSELLPGRAPFFWDHPATVGARTGQSMALNRAIDAELDAQPCTATREIPRVSSGKQRGVLAGTAGLP